MKKQKISISVDEDTLKRILEGISKGVFRNRSHAFEFAIKEVMEKNETKKQI